MPDLRAHSSAGYLLIEALVALAIVAVMASLLFGTVIQTSQAALVVGDRREAVLLARSVLAAATAQTPIPPIPDQGTDGPFSWTISRDTFSGAGGEIRLEQVVVTISRRSDGRLLARLAGADASR